MPGKPYSERSIYSVDVMNLRTGIASTGQEVTVADVIIGLSDGLNADRLGPTAKVKIGLLGGHSDSIVDVETRAIAAAHELLVRLAQEPPEALGEAYRRSRSDEPVETIF